MKIAQEKKITNYYPLVENFVRRPDVIEYVERHGLKKPQRSSCYFCPYHSDDYWMWLQKYHPDEFQKAVLIDKHVRRMPGVDGDCYLHDTCKPLDQVEFNNQNQLNAFPHLIDECDGECGI
jgi:hypothetical protein